MSTEGTQEAPAVQPAPAGTVVVIGGGQAAGWVVKTLRKEGFDGRLVMIADEIQSGLARTGLPPESSTRPVSTIRSPCGSPACPVVRSASPGVTRSAPSSGPVISVSRCGSSTRGWLGARSADDP